MCGLTGFICSQPLPRERLLAATQSLERRGPDGQGCFWDLDDRVGLGHRRLAIVDTPDGAQPLHNEEGSLTLVVNGEFYGHAELRKQLETRGHRFTTQSDSEVALHLYEERGLDFVEDLRGEFALLLWDRQQQRMVAARDRFGVKPLVYATLPDGALWFASRARALFAAGLPARWDPEAFACASATQYVPPESTLFAGIHQVPPGCLMICQAGETRLHRYWQYPLTTEVSAPDAVEEFRALLDDSVRCRLPSEHPAAFQLSGGLDSAAVVAMASRCLGPVDAFTVSFDTPAFDETALAREIAEYCGARWHPVPASREDLLNALPEAVMWSEGLAVNAHFSGKFLLSRAIRDAGFKVVLTGEGADEVLLGYPHFRKDLDPDAPLLRDNEASAGIMLSDSAGLSLLGVEEKLGHVPTFFRAKAALGYRMRSLMVAFPPVDHFEGMLEGLDLRRTPVERAAWLWNRSALANYILHTLGDGCEMAHSVEGRLPFLDHRLVELLARLPQNFKIYQGVEKYILREAVRPLVPESLYLRKKHPFIAPPLGQSLVSQLREEARADHPFVDSRLLQHRLDTLDELDPQQRREWEPALTWILTSYLLQKGFGLSVA